MKKLLFLLVGTFSLLLLNGCAKDEENLNGTISGLVTDYTNANTPIAGATVTLNTKGLTKTTGSDGRFEFVGVEPGTYSLQISANNYQTTTKQVTVYAGQTANCDVQLTKGSASVDITPESLTFGKDVEQLSFTISNNSNQSLVFSISNAPDFVEVTPASGTIAAKAQKAISVHVLNRSSITTNRTGQLTVNIGNDSYVVSLAVTNSTTTDPDQGGEGGDNQGGSDSAGEISVTRGLLAYYTFDDETANNTYRSSNNGNFVGEPTFTTATPDGRGKALSLDSKQYVNIPNNMLDQKTAYTISFWIKDFGTGSIFSSYGSESGIGMPSIIISSDSKAQVYYGILYSVVSSVKMNFVLSAYQSSGWHMMTVTASYTDGLIILYIDGVRVDAQSGDIIIGSGTKMFIGGNCENYFKSWADPMLIDNVRIHSVALSDAEVKQIYENKQ